MNGFSHTTACYYCSYCGCILIKAFDLNAGQRCYHRFMVFTRFRLFILLEFLTFAYTPSMKVGNYFELASSSSSSLCIQRLLMLLLSISFYMYVSPITLILFCVMTAASFSLLLDAQLVIACFQGGNNNSTLPPVKWKNWRFLQKKKIQYFIPSNVCNDLEWVREREKSRRGRGLYEKKRRNFQMYMYCTRVWLRREGAHIQINIRYMQVLWIYLHLCQGFLRKILRCQCLVDKVKREEQKKVISRFHDTRNSIKYELPVSGNSVR